MKKFLYIISMMIFVVSAAYAAEIPGAQVPLTITDPLTGQNLDCEKGDSWLGSFYGCEYPNARWCGYDSKWRDCSEGLCNEDYDGDDVVIKGYGTKDGNVWAWGASKSDPSDWHDVCWIKKDSALETLIKNQPDHSAKAKKNSNTNRIIADATAGVVLGTVSGLITSSVIKKNQIKNGFDDLECSSSGTKIADWGDEFMIRGAITKSECEAASGGRNNIFVWASKDSTGADYATLKEDTKTPDNNACWARADIISKDPNINTELFKQRWFKTGSRETCGGWLDEVFVRNKILESKKSKRTWGTVAGVVGGAAVGVGAMELFGNKALGIKK